MPAIGWRKRQTMQWVPNEKKNPATELSMESLEEVVEELKGLKDRGIAIAIKPTKVMFRPLDFENKRRDDAFAEAEKQEPIGWFAYEQKMRLWFETNQGEDDSVPLYTHPQPKREWQGLTDEERQHFRALGFVGVEQVEAKLREKNT